MKFRCEQIFDPVDTETAGHLTLQKRRRKNQKSQYLPTKKYKLRRIFLFQTEG